MLLPTLFRVLIPIFTGQMQKLLLGRPIRKPKTTVGRRACRDLPLVPEVEFPYEMPLGERSSSMFLAVFFSSEFSNVTTSTSQYCCSTIGFDNSFVLIEGHSA